MLPRALLHYGSSLRSYGLAEPELRSLQASKLRRILSVADSTIPHYHRMFRRLGLSPSDIAGVSGIGALPTLTKKEVVAGYPDSFLPGHFRPEVVKRGSGTTGQPMKFAASGDTLDIRHALFLRRLTVLGYKPWKKIATLWGPTNTWRRQAGRDGVERPSTSIMEYPVMIMGRPIPTVRIVAADALGFDAQAALLARTKPAFIFCRPSHLLRVGKAMERLGLSAKPECIVVGNEAVTQSAVRELGSMFGAVVARQYGSAEFGGVGAECKAVRGIHVSEDYYVCEVLKDGEQVSPGESGELVLTSLHNGIMPLIRFRTGDIVELEGGGRCACGTCHVRLRSVQGRESDGLVTASGRRILPLHVADRMETEFGFRDYQLLQRAPGSFLFRGGAADLADEGKLASLKGYLEEVVGEPISLSTEARSEDDFWTKSRPVLSLVDVPR